MNCRVQGEGKMDKFIPNWKYLAIITLCKPVSKNFAPNIMTEIVVSFNKVWSWNKREVFYVFSFIRLKDDVDFLVGKCLEDYYFPSAFVIVAKKFRKGFFRSFFSKYVFLVIGK